MNFYRTTSSRLAFLLGIATASGLALSVSGGGDDGAGRGSGTGHHGQRPDDTRADGGVRQQARSRSASR
jgi:hypothetical protein